MTRGDLRSEGNEGEPTWWTAELRNKILNLRIDLEELYNQTNIVDPVRARRKERLKKLIELNAPEDIINKEREIAKKDPFDYRQVAQDTMMAFAKSSGGLTKTTLRLALPFLWQSAQTTANPENAINNLLWLCIGQAMEGDISVQELVKSAGRLEEGDKFFADSEEDLAEFLSKNGIKNSSDQLSLEAQQGKF